MAIFMPYKPEETVIAMSRFARPEKGCLFQEGSS
jgi:hypothetical protein